MRHLPSSDADSAKSPNWRSSDWTSDAAHPANSSVAAHDSTSPSNSASSISATAASSLTRSGGTIETAGHSPPEELMTSIRSRYRSNATSGVRTLSNESSVQS